MDFSKLPIGITHVARCVCSEIFGSSCTVKKAVWAVKSYSSPAAFHQVLMERRYLSVWSIPEDSRRMFSAWPSIPEASASRKMKSVGSGMIHEHIFVSSSPRNIIGIVASYLRLLVETYLGRTVEGLYLVSKMPFQT
jgi:hypothetical protein